LEYGDVRFIGSYGPWQHDAALAARWPCLNCHDPIAARSQTGDLSPQPISVLVTQLSLKSCAHLHVVHWNIEAGQCLGLVAARSAGSETGAPQPRCGCPTLTLRTSQTLQFLPCLNRESIVRTDWCIGRANPCSCLAIVFGSSPRFAADIRRSSAVPTCRPLNAGGKPRRAWSFRQSPPRQ
jgi:hypothetical protein